MKVREIMTQPARTCTADTTAAMAGRRMHDGLCGILPVIDTRGKLIGVVSFSWLAVRLGVARLPDGVSWHHIVGVAAVAGVGFTVSLFIAGLAFTGSLLDDAKAGVLAASLLASMLGATLLARASRRDRAGGAHRNP